MSVQLIPIPQALDHLLADVHPTTLTVEMPLAACLGYVLAEDQVASMDVPAYDNSAMDGYAINTEDFGAGQTRWNISQKIAAGHPGQPLARGTAARIFTGAPVPLGADAIIMQENAVADGAMVSFSELPRAGQNIRLKGHDLATGHKVLEAGRRLQPQDLGLLASLGIGQVRVYKPLVVAILNTGDEVVAPGQTLAPGQLYDSNSFMLAAALQALGMQVHKIGIVADNLEATRKALIAAAGVADCVISTGGVSVGDEDHVKPALESLGELSLWKLAIKPGKPFSFGRIGTIPFFGLPGNPVAVFVTWLVLVRPALLRMQGAEMAAVQMLKVSAGFVVEEAGSRQEYLRVRLQQLEPDGLPVAVPFSDQGSSLLSSLSWADGLVIIPRHETVRQGSLLNYIPFRGVL